METCGYLGLGGFIIICSTLARDPVFPLHFGAARVMIACNIPNRGMANYCYMASLGSLFVPLWSGFRKDFVATS